MQVDAAGAPRARLTGIVYVAYFVIALPAAARGPLIVPADAATTAARVLGAEGLYRFTIACDVVGDGLYIALTYLLYTILRAVSPSWARLAVLFSLAGCLIQAVSTVALLGPLVLLHDETLHALTLAQRQDLSLVAIRMFGQGYGVGLLFFGAFDLVMGILLVVARLVPRVLGWLVAVAGVGWLILSLVILLAPGATGVLQRIVLPLGGLAEVALAVWLLVRGINRSAWEQAARRSAPRGR